MRVEKEFMNIYKEALDACSQRTSEAWKQLNAYIDNMGWSDNEYDVAANAANLLLDLSTAPGLSENEYKCIGDVYKAYIKDNDDQDINRSYFPDFA